MGRLSTQLATSSNTILVTIQRFQFLIGIGVALFAGLGFRWSTPGRQLTELAQDVAATRSAQQRVADLTATLVAITCLQQGHNGPDLITVKLRCDSVLGYTRAPLAEQAGRQR